MEVIYCQHIVSQQEVVFQSLTDRLQRLGVVNTDPSEAVSTFVLLCFSALLKSSDRSAPLRFAVRFSSEPDPPTAAEYCDLLCRQSPKGLVCCFFDLVFFRSSQLCLSVKSLDQLDVTGCNCTQRSVRNRQVVEMLEVSHPDLNLDQIKDKFDKCSCCP